MNMMTKRSSRAPIPHGAMHLRVQMTPKACFTAAGGLALVGLLLMMADR
jgi:hypothetical protein